MKKVTGQVKLQIPAGKANPAPPIGPALGQQGVNIMEFCKQFNAKTQEKMKGSGAHKPGKEKVGQITRKQLEEIARKKMPDMTSGSLEAAMNTIAGTARSMGIEIVG